MKRLPLTLVSAAAFTLANIGTPAWADGGWTPSTAPPLALGITYFGDSDHYDENPRDDYGDYWRLPNLMAQDKVTLAGRSLRQSAWHDEISVCITSDVDDYSYSDNECSNSASVGDVARNGFSFWTVEGRRIWLVAQRASNNNYLEIGNNEEYTGPYQFVVESIQHQVGLTLQSSTDLRRKGIVRVSGNLTDGSAMPDGLVLNLTATSKRGSWSLSATSRAGSAAFRMKLPKRMVGHPIRLQVTSAETAQFQQAQSPKHRVRITR